MIVSDPALDSNKGRDVDFANQDGRVKKKKEEELKRGVLSSRLYGGVAKGEDKTDEIIRYVGQDKHTDGKTFNFICSDRVEIGAGVSACPPRHEASGFNSNRVDAPSDREHQLLVALTMKAFRHAGEWNAKLEWYTDAVIDSAAARKWASTTGEMPHMHRIQTPVATSAVALRLVSDISGGPFASPSSPLPLHGIVYKLL
ncbi:hypothetical protein EVAR_6980_1 [Eumeta japonica]|uniref:Uncharacterized protein n=1 Tax=Eumeta variegata TaxID=151549 RepID=A0A4C1TGL6_EUMVA|nr:hypothetical protein EVAR_6980_1 [Eumeta japonica]